MKKHIAFMISCIMFAVCFSFPVFAAGQAQQKVTTSTWTTHTPSGINMSASAVKLYGQATYNAQGRQDIIVTVQLENVSSNDIGIYGLWITPQDNTATIRNINEYGVITGDISIMIDSPQSTYNAVFNILGGENNSYIGNGTLGSSGYEYIVVPAHDTFSFSFYYGVYYNAGSSSTDYVLNSLTVGCRGSISGDIPHGIAVDNSDVVNALIDLLSDGNNYSIYDLLAQFKGNPASFNLSDNHVIYHSYSQTSGVNGVYPYFYTYSESPVLVNTDIDYVPADPDLYLNNSVYKIPIHVKYFVINRNNITYKLNDLSFQVICNNSITSTNGNYLGYNYEFNSDYFVLNSPPVNKQFIFRFSSKDLLDRNSFIYAEGNYGFDLVFYLYYSVSQIDSSVNVPQFSGDFTLTAPSITYSPYGIYIPSSSNNLLSQIRDRIQQLIDGNTSENQDISDESGTVADTQDTIHEQEQQWYSDNEAAIEATGLSNFEFSSGELDGLTQLRLQFAQVWGALGDWTLVYIFVLSLSLATFILRHRPTTKAQQRMADSAQYRADVRNRWAVQDARAYNNSNGFSEEIWRRAGYR